MILIQPAASTLAAMHVAVQHASEMQAKLFTANAGRGWAAGAGGTNLGIRGAEVISH